MAIYLCARARKIKHNMLQFVCTNGKNFWFIFGWLFNTGALRKLYLDADLRWYLRQLIQSLHCTRNQDHWLEVRVRWSLYVTENCFPCLREKKRFHVLIGILGPAQVRHYDLRLPCTGGVPVDRCRTFPARTFSPYHFPLATIT